MRACARPAPLRIAQEAPPAMCVRAAPLARYARSRGGWLAVDIDRGGVERSIVLGLHQRHCHERDNGDRQDVDTDGP